MMLMLPFPCSNFFRKFCVSTDFDVCNACLNSSIPVAFPIFEDKPYILFLAFISLMNTCEILTSALWFWAILSKRDTKISQARPP